MTIVIALLAIISGVMTALALPRSILVVVATSVQAARCRRRGSLITSPLGDFSLSLCHTVRLPAMTLYVVREDARGSVDEHLQYEALRRSIALRSVLRPGSDILDLVRWIALGVVVVVSIWMVIVSYSLSGQIREQAVLMGRVLEELRRLVPSSS